MRALILLLLPTIALACPTEEQEPVSICRAEKACPMNKWGMLLSGAGSGMSHQPNQAEQHHNLCIQENLQVQQANAELRLKQQELNAKLKKKASESDEDD